MIIIIEIFVYLSHNFNLLPEESQKMTEWNAVEIYNLPVEKLLSLKYAGNILNENIDFTFLSTGMYFVKVYTGSGSVMVKMLKPGCR